MTEPAKDEPVIGFIRKFVDMDGNEIDLLTWARMYEDFPNRILANDKIQTPDGPATIITIWTGEIDTLSGRRPFETGIVRGDRGETIAGYYTKDHALAGHAAAVGE